VSDITLPRAAEQVRKALELALESQFAPDDVECEHGMHYRDCSNNVCVMRDCKAALAALDAALAEPESKTPAWWMDGLTATLMREGVNKHRAREIAVGYWEAYCQIPGNEEDKT
jgi:hypothetical protein